MKKSTLLILLTIFGCQAAYAKISVEDHYLFVGGVDAPPALLILRDARGNKSGVDETKQLDEVGGGSSISNIQGSDVEQQNIASDEPPTGQSQSNTSWSIYVMDQPAQTYSVDLIGIKSGAVSVDVSGGYVGGGRKSIKRVRSSFIVTQGVTRSLSVTYDPVARTIGVRSLVNNGDLLRDTQAACGLGAIGPPEACEALEALAATVEKAKTKGDSKLKSATLEFYLSILNRLHNWGQKGNRQDWDDFKGRHECDHLRGKKGEKFFAKDPAYSALKLDAETLLTGLPQENGHGKDGH